jgi:hypothetical protein
MQQIRRISIGSATLFGAVLAGVYVFIAALAIYILEILGLIGEGELLGNLLGLTVGTFVGVLVAGIFAAAAGAIAGFVYAAIYNIVAGITGGLVIDLENAEQ